MKTKKRPRSLTIITLALTAAIFMMWCAAMFCITDAVAQSYFELLVKDGNTFADTMMNAGGFHTFVDDRPRYESMKETPGYVEYLMLNTLRWSNSKSLSYSGIENGAINVMRDVDVPMRSAVMFCGANGNILHKNGDFIYFRYATENVWKAEKEEQTVSGYSWVDLGDGGGDTDPFSLFRVMYSGTRSLYDIRALRITGYMEGSEIIPVKMDYYTETLLRQALDKREPDEQGVAEDGSTYVSHTYTLSGLEREGILEWQSIFDNSDVAERADLVTIYALNPDISIYDAGDSVHYQGAEYESLAALLEYPIHGSDYFGSSSDSYGLMSTIMFGSRYFHDYTGWNASEDNLTPPLEFYMVTAIECSPLGAAMNKLRNVYIVTFLLAVIAVLASRNFIKRNMTEPLANVIEGIGTGWTNIPSLVNYPPKWREPYELGEHYNDIKDKLSQDKDNIARLERAVKYAEDAEENRRQMTSSIAHELKTPLAIIHSYAEGLNERIAEEKRDKYLGVILSETERMDGMVLEMLDLSRLEAGKVKLSREDFSLSELTASVFERLERAIEAKELKLTLALAEDCVISADPVRVEQVITNFAANAVKYTPHGGTIQVLVTKNRGAATLAVENDSPPLSNDALSKIWETFYRADESRTGTGTGLGLAIAKSIIDLHGGKCMARNTKTGVEFSFTI